MKPRSAGQGLDVTTVDAEQASRLGLAKAAVKIWGTLSQAKVET